MANSLQLHMPARRYLTRSRRIPPSILLSLPALLVVFALFVYPCLYGIVLSLHGGLNGEKGWTLDNFVQIVRDPNYVHTIWVTFIIALPVTFFSVAVSVPLAYFMRSGIRFERSITTLLILPVTLGSVMIAQGMLGYFGPIGWFNRILQALGLIHEPLELLHNWLGVETALFIQGFPFVFLLILGYMSALNADLERASRMLGANAWQTFWRVLFPLAVPGIAVAFALNFVANFSVFPTANLVGEPGHATRVLTIAAYETAYNEFNLPLGTAIAITMGVLELTVVGIVLWLQSFVGRGPAITGGKGA
jgi:putative spermidine/putrescine transport system permease protein